MPIRGPFVGLSVDKDQHVYTDVRLALSGAGVHGYTVVAGLGGRAITKASLTRTLMEAVAGTLQPLTFMDLDWRIVNRQLEREAATRRSGPVAENLLRERRPTPKPRGSSRGSTRCSATPRRWPPASPRHSRSRATTTFA